VTGQQAAEVVAGFNRDLPAGATRFRLGWDGSRVTFGGARWPLDDDEGIEVVVRLVEQVQDQVIESVTGAAWPRCDHGTHPRQPVEAGWACPARPHSERDVWAYGTVADRVVPDEPARRDGQVRWFFQDRGWGLIAHSDGDLFVHFSFIEGDGYRTLLEGEHVEITSVGRGMQGRLRQAMSVRRLGFHPPPAET